MKKLLAVPFVLLLLAAVASGGDREQAALKPLQGKWKMADLEVDGQLVPPAKLDGATLSIKGAVYTVTNKKGTSITCTLKVDDQKKPAQIDMIFAEPGGNEKTLRGIYELSGNTFKVARGLDAKQERPGQFATWPGTSYFVVTWQRE